MQTDTPSQERDTELSTDLVAHLREEADFNRSWIDGRRRAYASDAVGYAARRKAFADRADNWADEITRLRKELQAAQEALKSYVVAPGSLPDDCNDECWICAGSGEATVLLDNGGTEYAGCPDCICRDHSERARAALGETR